MDWNDTAGLTRSLQQRAERYISEMGDRELTEDERTTVGVYRFLMKTAPYVFETPKQDAHDTH